MRALSLSSQKKPKASPFGFFISDSAVFSVDGLDQYVFLEI